MSGIARPRALYVAISLGLLVTLGFALTFSGGVARWLASSVWITTAALALAAVAAAAFRARGGRIGFAWRAWAVGTGFALAGAIAHNVTLSHAGPSLAEILWWLSALAFLSGQVFRAPPGDLSFRLYLLDAIPVVLAAAAAVQIVAGDALEGQLGQGITLLLNAILFPLVALIGLQMLALYQTRSAFLGATCFCLVGAGSILWSLQSLGAVGGRNWSALLWVLGLLALGWAGLERVFAPQKLSLLRPPANEAGPRAIPPAAAIVALILMAETVGHDHEMVLVGFAIGALVAFGARFYLIRREYGRSQRALGESERRFRSMFETASIGVAVSTPDSRLVEVNEALASMLGHEPAELVGMTVREITYPDDADRGLEHFRELLDGVRDSYSVEKRYVRKDGSPVWGRVNASVVRDGQGRPQLGIGMIEDISSHKRAEHAIRESENRYRTLIENIPGAVFRCTTDADWTITFMSDDIEEISGYPASDFVGNAERTFASIVHPNDRRLVEQAVRTALATKAPFVVEFRLMTATGEMRWVYQKAQPVFDGDAAWFDGVILDITDRRRTEHEREQLLETLESHNEQLRALDKMKDEFVALVSHELRTPLTSILGYLELVLEGEAGEVTDDQRHFLSVVERNSQRLLRLVGDLLFVAQIEAGKLALECEAVDLGVIVSECLEAARPRADEKRIDLVPRVASVPLLNGDRVRLAQLLDNLVSNAIKFTPEGGRVTIGLEHREGSVVLEVSDTGMGIPPEEQSRLFERFFRTSSATKNAIQGTGLGLVITKAIAEAHRGRITLESEESIGTTFRVELPVRAGLVAVGEAA